MTATSESAEKRVSWAELFFDLVFVLAVTQVSALLAHDHSAVGLLRAAVVFVPVYWTWVGTAVQANLRDTEPVRTQLAIFLIALAAIFLALALPDAYGRLGLSFAIAYWGGRVVLVLLNLGRATRVSVNPYLVSAVLTGPMLLVGALVHGEARLGVGWPPCISMRLISPNASVCSY